MRPHACLSIVSSRLVLPCAAAALALCGCGGGGGGGVGGNNAVAPLASATEQPPTVSSVRPGPVPFIAFVDLKLPAATSWTDVRYRIEPKAGSVSRPVDVDYAMAYLARRGYASNGSSTLTVPVFGLYANFANEVEIHLQSSVGSPQEVHVEIDTVAYSDPNGIYDRPTILKPRAAHDGLSFSYFYIKSALGSPVVVDTDGQVRWVTPGNMASVSSTFDGNRFVIGSSTSVQLEHLELDGTSTTTALTAPDLTDFNHNIDPGKVGVLVDLDATRDGVPAVESTLAEIDPDSGTILARWDIGDTLSRFMLSHGDDPTQFVRPGVDWFHMNAAAYDPSDDSVIVSSRENFLMKMDYASGDLIWVLGDPTKYWHSFASLASQSLSLEGDGLYPIGQHAVSLTHDGLVQVVNDGLGSENQPPGAPAGESRDYSAVSTYEIDGLLRRAVEVRRFDDAQAVFSPFCSSAYQAPADNAMLVDFAIADQATHAYVIGLGADQQLAFDFRYETTGCNTSWNAKPIPFEAMRFHG
jgi:hypothetical protein